MAQIPAKLVAGSQLTAAAANYYTSPANTKTIIKSMQLVNTTTGAVTATLYLVPSGGTASATNTVISSVNIAPNATYNCPEAINQVLNAGDSIQALASAATSISLQAAGIQVI